MGNLSIKADDVKSYFQGHWDDFFNHFVKIESSNNSWHKILCPFHGDTIPSGWFNSESGRFGCHSCGSKGDAFEFYQRLKGIDSFSDAIKGIATEFKVSSGNGDGGNSSTEKSKIVATYDYKDISGSLLYQVVRFEPKSFRQRRPDGSGGWTWNMKGVKRVLYNLPEVVRAEEIIVTEGEKDTESLRKLGFTATTNVGGATKWDASYNDSLRGKDVVVLPDADDPGVAHAQKVAKSLFGVAQSVKILELPGLPEKGDVSDWIDAGATEDQLRDLIDRCPPCEPGPHSDDGQYVAEDSQVWEQPILLEDILLPEMEPLPGIIGEISDAISKATETPIELSQGLVLATVATACQGRFIVQAKAGYAEPLNVWIVVALDSGNRKSSVLIETTRPLVTWESKRRMELEQEIRVKSSKRLNQEQRLKTLRSKYGSANIENSEDIEHAIRVLESELIEVPTLPRLWVDDITTETLGSLMAKHGERMSVLSAEGGVFETISGRYSRGIPNMDLYLKGHAGDPARVDRGSRDPIYLQNPCLTLGLSPQPEILREMASLPGFRGRGFIARCGFLLPKSPLGFRTLKTEPLSQSLQIQYEKTIHSLLDIDPVYDEKKELVPSRLFVSQTAFDEWMEFSKVVELNLRDGGLFEGLKDWGGKLPGFGLRISGILHCAEFLNQSGKYPISIGTMRRALDLAGVFSQHAMAVFRWMGTNKSLEGARKTWQWVQRSRLAYFTKRDAHQAMKGSHPTVSEIDPFLGVLEDRLYIRKEKQEPGVVGRPSCLYRVNPYLMEDW